MDIALKSSDNQGEIKIDLTVNDLLSIVLHAKYLS